MIHTVLTPERLESILRQVPKATEVKAERENGRLIAVVVSEHFDGMEEHERQSEVWSLLLDQLDETEQATVGYVFTNTRSEKQQAEEDARAASAR